MDDSSSLVCEHDQGIEKLKLRRYDKNMSTAALRDACITGENAYGISDGLGSSLGAAYQSATTTSIRARPVLIITCEWVLASEPASVPGALRKNHSPASRSRRSSYGVLPISRARSDIDIVGRCICLGGGRRLRRAAGRSVR